MPTLLVLTAAWREYATRAVNLHGLALCLLGPVAVGAAVASTRLGRGGPLLLSAVLLPAFLVFAVGYRRAPAASGVRSYVAPLALLRAARRRLRTTLVAGATAGVLVGAGVQLRVLPGLLLVGLLWPLAGILVAERRGPLESIARVAGLLHRDLPGTAAIGAAFAGATYGIVSAVARGASPLGEPAALALATAIACTLVAPLAATVFLHGYRVKARGLGISLRPPVPATYVAERPDPRAAPEPATEQVAASSSVAG